jgi:hypothetical protein
MSGIIQSGPLRFQNSSHRYIRRSVSLDGEVSPRKFALPPCRSDNPYIVIMWFVWIAGIEGKRYVGTSVDSMI